MPLRLFLSFSVVLSLLASPVPAAENIGNHYTETHFIANKPAYNPQVKVEPKLVNAWGIAIRPKGAGGHFWITASDTSYQYVGDVSNAADAKLQKLHVEDVPYVTLPVGKPGDYATSTVFSGSKESFVITQTLSNAAPITAPAKFLFASTGGIISAWTERKHEDGTFDRSDKAVAVIDESSVGAQFFGLAVNAAYDRIYAANFGKNAGIAVFDANLKPVALTFDAPFDSNKNGKVDIGEYAPYNVQSLTTPSGEHHLFVTYAKTQACNAEGIAKQECRQGEIYAGEEDTSKPGQGRLAEFTEDGRLVAVWSDGGYLSAPWGVAYAPANFGALSNTLLVANFGSGTIAAFDPQTHEHLDDLRDAHGNPIHIEKIWGILFGNGESLGDANALYFTAGPNDEKDGMFGSVRIQDITSNRHASESRHPAQTKSSGFPSSRK